MKFCPDCGTKLAGPRKFCTSCKRIYSTDQKIVSSSPIHESDKIREWREGNVKKDYDVAKSLDNRSNPKDESSDSTKIIWFAIIFVCFFAIFLIPHTETCSSCGGDGVIQSSYSSEEYGSSTFQSDCYMCGGSGQVTYGFWYGLWFFWFFGFGFWWWIFFWPVS
tara:strand:- start:64 stop:555 length:492 start_codon:yes stop_codon:yes gene_type:complete